MKNLFYLIILGGLFACHGKSDPDSILIASNFDGLEGWGLSHASLTKVKSFSGKYALQVNENIEFSLGFAQTLQEVTSRKPKKLRIACRAYLPESSAKAKLVISIEDPKTGQSKFWNGIVLSQKTKDYREWAKITAKVNLPENIQLTDNLKCYLWRSENYNQPVFIDDLTVSVLEWVEE